MSSRAAARASRPSTAVLTVAAVAAMAAFPGLAASAEPAVHVDVESKPARAPKGAIVHVTAIVTAREDVTDVERTEGGVCLVRVFAFYPDDRVLVTRDGEQVEVVVTGTPSALVVPLDELKRKLKLP